MTKQRVVLVTGASRGLGAAIARRLGRDGFKVAVNYFNNPAMAGKVVDAITADGGMAQAFRADVTDPEAVKKLIADVTAAYGPVEILVN
ncbi:MAG: SDR family NAD(P)-dependent oxidoreductase, partial [Planctomycetes bacterium]|nr:SDR family NAD(P)-dependent oxidoreductase [Planctomycetota bacterium]